MKRPALQNKQVVILRMAFRARKVLVDFRQTGPRAHKGTEEDKGESRGRTKG